MLVIGRMGIGKPGLVHGARRAGRRE
jgi:hypothetical protein